MDSRVQNVRAKPTYPEGSSMVVFFSVEESLHVHLFFFFLFFLWKKAYMPIDANHTSNPKDR